MAAEPSDLLPRLFDVVPVAVAVAGPDGRLMRLNEAARRLLGFRPGEAEGSLRLSDLLHRPEEVRSVRDLVARRPGDASPLGEALDLQLRARNGEVITVRVTASNVRGQDGTVVGTVCAFEDRREMVSLAGRLAEAIGQVELLEQKTSGQAALGRAAHELSQPLTAALGHIDMLMIEGGVTPAGEERLERAAEQLERMRSLVHEFARVANQARGGGR
jgi:PAS domain S-box-containing protein